MTVNPAEGKSYLAGQWHDLLDLIYPPVCGLCGKLADSDDRLICEFCWSGVKGLEAPYCSTCQVFLRSKPFCTRCDEPSMTVYSLGYFDNQMQTILHDLKYRQLKPLGPILGQKLADLISRSSASPTFDLILAVPLHHSRQYKRGFNQAEEIASGIAAGIEVATIFSLLHATRKTRQQAKLPASRREENVRDAYTVIDPDHILENKTVLLVDDVTTTGATLRENRRVILDAGARMVLTAVAATAYPVDVGIKN